MELKLELILPPDDSISRGRNDQHSITLLVSNIYKDCNSDFDEFIKGLIYIYAVEFVCSYVLKDKWTNNEIPSIYPLCYNKHYCPIAKIIRKNGYKYNMGLSPKEFIF